MPSVNTFEKTQHMIHDCDKCTQVYNVNTLLYLWRVSFFLTFRALSKTINLYASLNPLTLDRMEVMYQFDCINTVHS